MRDVTLSVLERLVLFPLLPASGNVTEFIILEYLRKTIGFPEQEQDEIGLTATPGPDGGVNYSWESEKEITVKVGEKGERIIKDALRKLDQHGGVNAQNIDLLRRFGVVPDEPLEDEIPADYQGGLRAV